MIKTLPVIILVAIDNTTKRFIRRGENQNNGASQTDVFIVDKQGNINVNTPVLWDYNNIDSLIAYPIDEEILTIKGGKFTTLANSGTGVESYMNRGINITRSNTVIEILYHYISKEGKTGAPYNGFLTILKCAYVTIENTILSGHKVYKNPNNKVNRGTYDISANLAINMTIKKCEQMNDINNSRFWGIFTSNNSKNIIFENVKFSRFDAHMGVHNATIRNSEIGWQGILAIGSGLLIVENTKVNANKFITLRSDYGSSWNGDFVIKNCIFAPSKLNNAVLIGASNDGQWDFGYQCYMPDTVTIDGFYVDDKNAPSDYSGIMLFGNFNANHNGSEPYPYITTKNINIKGFVSNKEYRITTNTYLSNNLNVNIQDK